MYVGDRGNQTNGMSKEALDQLFFGHSAGGTVSEVMWRVFACPMSTRKIDIDGI